MLKKTISYTDYHGNKRTEDFYFNLTKAEVAEMEVSEEGGLIEMIKRIVAADDKKVIVAIFKDLILRSYGEKSPDGRKFVKNNELRAGFENTAAYSELFMEMATVTDAATTFVQGVLPKIESPDTQNTVPQN